MSKHGERWGFGGYLPAASNRFTEWDAAEAAQLQKRTGRSGASLVQSLPSAILTVSTATHKTHTRRNLFYCSLLLSFLFLSLCWRFPESPSSPLSLSLSFSLSPLHCYRGLVWFFLKDSWFSTSGTHTHTHTNQTRAQEQNYVLRYIPDESISILQPLH